MGYEATSKVIFVQVIDDKSFVIACRCCEGTGRCPRKMAETGRVVVWANQYPCKICAGKGMLRLESDDIPTNCGPCFGSGRTMNLSADRYDPSGEKYVHKGPVGYVNDNPCHLCDGLGVRSLTGKIRKMA